MENLRPSFIEKISKAISFVFNPLFSLVVYFLYFGWKNYTPGEMLQRFWPILVIIILPVAGWILWNVKTGRYTNTDVSDRRQRQSLYFFIEAVMALYLVFEYLRHDKMDMMMLFILILIGVMQISNYFIKSSMHTAFNIFVAALFFTQNPLLGLVWLGISIVVGFSRIILKRHTPQEVIAGAAISIVISFIYLYTNIQFNH